MESGENTRLEKTETQYWHNILQVNETYMVKSVCNIEYEPEYISVFDHLCDDYNSFQDVSTLS